MTDLYEKHSDSPDIEEDPNWGSMRNSLDDCLTLLQIRSHLEKDILFDILIWSIEDICGHNMNAPKKLSLFLAERIIQTALVYALQIKTTHTTSRKWAN